MKKIIATILGLALIFSIIDDQMADYKITGIAVTPGPFRNGATLSPENVIPEGHVVPILFGHNTDINSLLGQVTLLIPTPDYVYFEGVINLDRHYDLANHIDLGNVAYLSIGFIPLGMELPDLDDPATIPSLHITGADLMEISIVVLPMDPRARILTFERMGLIYKITETLTRLELYWKSSIKDQKWPLHPEPAK